MSVVKNKNYLTRLEKIFQVELVKILIVYEQLVSDRQLGTEIHGRK